MQYPEVMDVRQSSDQAAWDTFLSGQTASPFLQSWTMGNVYEATNQSPIRLELRDSGAIVGICQGIVVPARRGRHIAVQYGPVMEGLGIRDWELGISLIIEALKEVAKEHHCSFIRMSPFWDNDDPKAQHVQSLGGRPAPLHLLAEHVWHLPLTNKNLWNHSLPLAPSRREGGPPPPPGEGWGGGKSEEDIQKSMRKNTRNLIRRAQKEGVTISRSDNPAKDIDHFIRLHEETRKRHQFTPYTNQFFKEQLLQFYEHSEATLYLAHYQNEVIASSIHMHMGGETSYHHGASTHKYSKIPASYLLQWTAIQDALKRNDTMYNFWGIAPVELVDDKWKMSASSKKHPFAGVTTFKTGFGGTLKELVHCIDIPVSSSYYLTYAFETYRKWRRGF